MPKACDPERSEWITHRDHGLPQIVGAVAVILIAAKWLVPIAVASGQQSVMRAARAVLDDRQDWPTPLWHDGPR